MDNYEKFREILHRHPSGAPKSGAFDEILRILFTPEEVEVALGMVFFPRSVHEIAEKTAAPVDVVREHCESMANKGVVFSREKDGEMGYALLPTIPRKSITAKEEFKERLRKIREQGFSIDREEAIDGITGIAAPIRDYTGNVAAALGVGFISSFEDSKGVTEIVKAVSETAKNISRELGYWEK